MANFHVMTKTDPFSKRLDSGTVVTMSDGWRGRVDQDDGKTVTILRDGAERHNDKFQGYRGILRKSIRHRGGKAAGRSQVVDLAARSALAVDVTIVDRKRLEAEWESAPGYSH